MNSIIKTTMVFLLSLILFRGTSEAQGKYQYAYLVFSEGYLQYSLSIDGKEFKLFEMAKEEVKTLGKLNMIIKEIKKMEEGGWELFNVQTMIAGTTISITEHYYLFRKKVVE